MKDLKNLQYDASSEQEGLSIEYPTELGDKKLFAVGCQIR